MKYSKYFRKTSLKQKGHGEIFLNEVFNKKPKSFLEIGVFHGVTARNVCELLYQIHGNDFKYVGLDLFEKSDENKFEVIPSTNFKNPFKNSEVAFWESWDPPTVNNVGRTNCNWSDSRGTFTCYSRWGSGSNDYETSIIKQP